jgi:hypothetical protein
MAGDYDKRRLVEWLRAETQRQSGRRYDRLDLDSLDPVSLRELQRILRDLDAEQRMAVQRARICPRAAVGGSQKPRSR